MTFRQIGAALGVSNKTAHEDVVAYRDEVKRVAIWGDDPEAQRQRISGGIDAVVAANWRKRGKKPNAEIILDAYQQEARLWGLNLQRKDVYTSEQVLAVLRGITQLFMEIVQDPDARRQFSLGLKRKVGTTIAGIVESQQPQSPQPKPVAALEAGR